MPENFDNMAVVVDWLDACRDENLELLLECFADEAGLACGCEGIKIVGRSGLVAYWQIAAEGLFARSLRAGGDHAGR